MEVLGGRLGLSPIPPTPEADLLPPQDGQQPIIIYYYKAFIHFYEYGIYHQMKTK